MTSLRLDKGGLIDRSRNISFTFDGKAMTGHPGDTLASALLANGQLLMGRSFKYHRPRSVVTCGAAEPNALMEIGTGGRQEPNTRATMQELYDGLSARSQNCWPSLNHDVGAVNALASSLFVAGFYYKTFMWPKRFWETIYEPIIRKAAGLGRLSYEADPDRYEKAYAHCDVLVVGSGPAGLMAARTAARAGARVILADEHARLGGSLLREREEIGGTDGTSWAETIIAELATMPNVTLMARTTVFGAYDDAVFGAIERVQKHVAEPDHNVPVEKLWRIMTKRCVMATGAEERPVVFGGNDRPGVMMASAMRAYANQYGVAAGRSAAVFTSTDSGYRTALDMRAHGIHVEAIIDSRADAPGLETGGVPVIRGALVTNVNGGKNGMSSAEINGHDTIPCQSLAMSGGWSPVVHLACQRGARPVWDEARTCFMPPEHDPWTRAAGSANGHWSLSECLAEGAERGEQAATAAGFTPKRSAPLPKARDDTGYAVSPLWWVKQSTGKAFIDYQNDVSAKDMPLAAREGYDHIELAKRYTTTGMATDQGKLGNVNAIAILAEATGRPIPEIGTTTFRPFYTPVSFGALGGQHVGNHFRPVRRSPLHGWADKLGAAFVESGLWYRSSWFPRAGEDWLAAMTREVLNTRANVGICDVSTLGKIEIGGKDAAEFLNRVYSNAFAKLPVGKARYGLMLREDGFVGDDGTTSRLADTRYFMTTTTGHAAESMRHLEFCHQALWPELDVQYVSVSDEWAQMAVAGPKSREVLASLVDADLSNEGFPFLGAREVTVMGSIPGRLFRISFSGELAYELAVPAGYGEAVASAIMHAGQPHGILPYGLEALNTMRIEKGFVTHNEINGRHTADDVGLGRMNSPNKDHIGRMLSQREAMQEPDRQQLVGVKPLEPSTRFRAGSHLLRPNDRPSTANDQGYVSSVAYSPALGAWIGLAMLKGGRERHGEKIILWDGLRDVYVEAAVCSPVFIDPEGEKANG
jgi:methylglutamate dehydrogenase subunit C